MWLSLTEYSNKHHVSISTLRRKIKSTEVKFRLDDGKYMILDSDEAQAHDSSVQRTVFSNEYNRPSLKSDKYSAEETKIAEPGESVITAANRLLADLKKAYTQVLQDKEEHISNLKEENTDLKTLIKVLESENDRLRGC